MVLSVSADEIRSWDKFKYELRKQNVTLFGTMLKECQQGDKKDDKEDREQFANAVKSKGEHFAAESLFMALILLLQQRMINKLIHNEIFIVLLLTGLRM